MIRRIVGFFFVLLCPVLLLAQSVTITGTIQQPIQQSISSSMRPASGHQMRRSLFAERPSMQTVTLLKLQLSNQAKQSIKNNIIASRSAPITASLSHYPRKIQLGMNEVPVLDQGTHGSCVVFTVTAAIDAILGKGDYISQLCQLELGNYLHNNSYATSGWNGSWGQSTYDQIEMFGVVPKSIQATGACGGLIEYPLMGDDPIEELSVFDYHQLSESIQEQDIIISPLIMSEQINSDFQDKDRLLFKIKRILNQGDRVTIGVSLLYYTRGNAGALGSHVVPNDTWILTPQIGEDFDDEDQFGGHAFIITGYDDDAIATDAAGRSYRGLFTLRNSWGDRVGNHGDFYMTYNYFKTFLLEAHHIRQHH